MQVLKPKLRRARQRLYLAAVDVIAGVTAVAGALAVSGGEPPGTMRLTERLSVGILLVVCWLLSLAIHGQYEFHPRWVGLAGLYRNSRAVIAGTLASVATAYFLSGGLAGSRAFYLIATALASVLFSLDRWLAIRLFGERVLRERYVLLGAAPRSMELVQALADGQVPSYVEVVGRIAVGEEDEGENEDQGSFPVLGGLDELPEVLVAREVTHVAVCPDVPHTAALSRATTRAEAMGAVVERLETVYENLTGRAPVLLAGADWGESLASVQAHPYMTRYKRVVDIFLTLALLPFTIPVICLAAVAIRMFMPGPILYRQKRVGKDGQIFTLIKLRTMVVDAEKETGAVWATEHDPRITPLGRLLRKFRLDELPQLWHVLRGEMSLVGPRPERPEFVSIFTEEIPFYERRLLVRPGITGWAQIHHRYDQSIDDVVEKLRYDLYYVRHVNFTLDLQILLRTLWVMLGRKGAV